MRIDGLRAVDMLRLFHPKITNYACTSPLPARLDVTMPGRAPNLRPGIVDRHPDLSDLAPDDRVRYTDTVLGILFYHHR